MFINKLVVHAVIQVSVVVLFIDSILFTAFRAEFDGSTRRDHICNLFRPYERRIISLGFLDLLIALIDEHGFDGVEWSKNKALLFLILKIRFVFADSRL